MADKTIGSLPQAQTVDDASLFVCEQQGVAMKTTGAQWKGFAVNVVSQYVEPAQQAAQQAQQAAQQAQDAADSIGDSVSQAQTAAQQAQAAQQAVENLGVTSNTLPVGQGATVTKTVDETGAVTLAFGIPQGPQGPQGPEGPQGGPGATGPQGEPGEAATVEIGSVTTGAPGTSAEVTNSGTAKAAVLNFTIPQGPQGAKGDTGPQGPQGETGEGFVVKGYFATLSALQSGVPSPSAGDAYGVGSAEPYDIYIWDGVNSAWVNNGPLQGAQGPQGDPGSAATIEIGTVTTAPAGSDAAVTNSGTSSAAVLNFTIPQGATGPQGPAGVDGSPGPAGADGAPGATGPQGEPGANATINGVTTLTINATGGIQGSQSGSTYTIDGGNLVPKVSGATAGNVPTLTAAGQLQDSGKSLDDLGGMYVVEIGGVVPDGPYEVNKSVAEIQAAYNAGKSVVAKVQYKNSLGNTLTTSVPLTNVTSEVAVFSKVLNNVMYLANLTISWNGTAVLASFAESHSHKADDIVQSSLITTDIQNIRVRGMSFSSTTPSSVSNGCLVGVYE